MNPSSNRVKVTFRCRAQHAHDLCVALERGVPPELRCSPDQSQGFGGGTGRGCQIPEDLQQRVERELRDAFQQSKRQGFVLIEE